MAAESSHALSLSLSSATTYGSVKVVNFTNKQRQGWVTTVVPIAKGAIFDTSPQTQLTAVGATLQDERVQWYPMGKRWSDGSIKYARCLFPVVIDAGTAGSTWTGYNGLKSLGLSYQYYQEKTVPITSEVTTPRAFVYHPKVLAGLLASSLVVKIEGENVPIPFFGNPPVVLEGDVESNPITGVPSSQYSNVKVSRTIARTTIKLNQANYWVEFLAEYGHNCRQVKFWLAVGNSLVTNDTNPVNISTANSLTQKIQAVFTGPISVNIRHDNIILPARVESINATVTPNIYTTTLTLIDPNDDVTVAHTNQRALFPDACYHVCLGSMVFNDTLSSGLDEDTAIAESQSDIGALSQDWGSYNAFGVFGHLLARPTNSFMTTNAHGYGCASYLANLEYTSMFNTPNYPTTRERRDPWTNGVYGFAPYGGSAASVGYDYGVVKGWMHARSGLPDLRAMQVSVYQEACRQMWPREVDVSIVKTVNHRDPAYPNNYTNLWYWNSTVHMVGNGPPPFTKPNPEGADGLGKQNGIAQTAKENNYFGGQDWSPWDREHIEPNCMMAYALLSGDRWVITNMLPELVENFIASWWPDNASAQSRSTIWEIKATRAEGRMQLTLANLYNITGDTRARDLAVRRMDTSLAQTASCNILEATYGPGSTIKIIKTLLTRTGIALNSVREPVVRNWEDAISIVGLYAASISVIEAYPSTAQLYLDMAKKISRTIAMYACRKNSQSGNVYQLAHSYCYQPGGSVSSEGEALCPSFPHTGCPKTIDTRAAGSPEYPNLSPEPLPGPYSANWGGGIDPVWIVPAFYAGYKWATEAGDTLWATRCKELLDQLEPIAEARAGITGWEISTSSSWTDHAAIVPDPFAARSAGLASLVTTISPFPSGVVANTTRLIGHPVTITGTGTITTFTSGGTPVQPNLFTNIVGTGVITTNTTKIHFIDLFQEFLGSGSIVANLTRTVLYNLINTITGRGTITTFTSKVGQVVLPEEVKVMGILKNDSKIIVDTTKMPAVNQTFEVWAGNNFTLTCTLVDTNGAPVNITGLTQLEWGVLKSPTEKAFFIKKDLSNGISVTNAAGGEFKIELLPIDTNGLDGPYYHECEISMSGKDYTIFTGNMTVNATAIQ